VAPNHQMIDVEAKVAASDNCGTVTVVLASIASSEADDGTGNGNTVDDIQLAEHGTADLHFRLRAERARRTREDLHRRLHSDRWGSQRHHRRRPLDRPPRPQRRDGPDQHRRRAAWSRHHDPMEHRSWGASYDVIRGRVGAIRGTSVAVDLGQVVCIEADSPDETTLGREDSEVPRHGMGFFDLVEYNDGSSSSYGTESASKPRAPLLDPCD